MNNNLPTRFTPTLSENFVTDGDRLLQFVDLVWTTPEGKKLVLDPWQREIVRRVLERYPDDWHDERLRGQLRHKSAVLSLPRQTGKSVLGSIFGAWALMLRGPGRTVFGSASDKDQADIIYKRVKHVVESNPRLSKLYKATGTRGITARNHTGSYVIKASSEAGLQGYPITGAYLADEIHLWEPEPYEAIMLGLSATDGILIGTTTAGSDKSKLLARLYEDGQKAIDGDPAYERFGFFVYEAPPNAPLNEESLRMANPAIACGRLPIEDAMNTMLSMSENSARRYMLNQFVSHTSNWLPLDLWTSLEVGEFTPEEARDADNLIISVDTDEKLTNAYIMAAFKRGDKINVQTIEYLPVWDIETLDNKCIELWEKYDPAMFVMDAANQKVLSDRLRAQGVPTEYFTTHQLQTVHSTVYALIARKQVVHANEPDLNRQITRGVAKNVGEGWRISRMESGGGISALMCMTMAVYAAEIHKDGGGGFLYIPAS